MSVVGIDFGNMQSCIAAARNRGIDILVNEVSNRFTPSMVAFNQKMRCLGETAVSQEISNLPSTIRSLKRLIGLPFDHPAIERERQFIPFELCAAGNEVGVRVKYLGAPRVFSATQICAMYLGRLREIAEKELGRPVTQAVVSVPAWFCPEQRHAVFSACQIAGFTALRVLNENTAAALAYGITKTDLPEPDAPRNVAFVDVGHSSSSVSIVSFVKGRLDVKAVAFDQDLGGRDIDAILIEHIAQKITEKHRFDVRTIPRALARLRIAIERLKKVLSANLEAPLNIDALYDDIDISFKVSRDELNAMIAPVVAKVTALVASAVSRAGMSADQISFVETIGGTTRMPSIRDAICAVFGRSDILAFTINQDEVVARGCALLCAIVSPTFRVRDFEVKDLSSYGFAVTYPGSRLAAANTDPNAMDIDQTSAQSDATVVKRMTVFPPGSVVSSTMMLTLKLSRPVVNLEAFLELPKDSNLSKLFPDAADKPLYRYTISNIPNPEDEVNKGWLSSSLKVRVRLTPDHLIHVEGAHVQVEEQVQVPAEQQPAAAASASSAGGADDTASATAAASTTTKRITRKIELPVATMALCALDQGTIDSFFQHEVQMHADDKLVLDTEAAKNNLEEFVYSVQSNVSGPLREFLKPEDADNLLKIASEIEEWMYSEDLENVTKSVFVDKLDSMRSVADPATSRRREHEERAEAARGARTVLNHYHQRLSNPENTHWLPANEVTEMQSRVAGALKTIEDSLAQIAAQPLHVSPPILCSKINALKTEIEAAALALLSRPKPVPAAAASADATASGKQEQAKDVPVEAAAEKENKNAQSNPQADYNDVDMVDSAAKTPEESEA